jgi:NDP-sugar pyrophosphorylase family protein
MYSMVILCGGQATRLYPVTRYIPKSLYPICGKPFIDYQLERLMDAGFNHIVLCVGNFGDQIRGHVGSGSKYGLNIEYSWDNLCGTGMALKMASPFLDDCFFVMYGDSYLTADFGDIQKDYDKSSFPCLMTIYKNNGNVFHENNVLYKKNKKLLSYGSNKNNNYIDYGTTILHKCTLDKIDNQCYNDLSKLYKYLTNTGQVMPKIIKKRFYEIGSINGVKDFTKLVIKKGL